MHLMKTFESRISFRYVNKRSKNDRPVIDFRGRDGKRDKVGAEIE